MGLVFMIVVSFANFFFILNINLNDYSNGEEHYIPEYTGDYPFINSFMTTYFICIGMFDVASFNKGVDGLYIWVMFLLATFVNLLVFMNMLIAIMTKTFDDVMDN